MTLPQYVELFWRAKQLHVTGSIAISYTYLDDSGDPPYPRVSGTKSHTIDKYFTRESSSGTPPIFTYFSSDEKDIFVDNLSKQRAIWSEIAEGYEGIDANNFFIKKDSDNKFWLTPSFGIGPLTNDSTAPNAVLNPGDTTQTDYGTLNAWSLVTATLKLHGTDVNFPMLWHALEWSSYNEIDDVVITSSSATIAISEWFPYKTSAGADAWTTSTGVAVNGGPGA